jgi:hypothetical protein
MLNDELHILQDVDVLAVQSFTPELSIKAFFKTVLNRPGYSRDPLV